MPADLAACGFTSRHQRHSKDSAETCVADLRISAARRLLSAWTFRSLRFRNQFTLICFNAVRTSELGPAFRSRTREAGVKVARICATVVSR